MEMEINAKNRSVVSGVFVEKGIPCNWLCQSFWKF